MIVVGTNWMFVPFDLYSLFSPISALFLCLLLTLGAIFLGSLLGLITGIISRRAALWVAGISFNLIYFVYCFNMDARYSGDPTVGMDGYQFLLAIVALGIWLLHFVPASRKPDVAS
jgi:hypothetical protein